MSHVAAYGGQERHDERQMVVVAKLYKCRGLLSMLFGGAWSERVSSKLMSG